MSWGSYVLVGYDGTKDAERALRWAAQEARLRHRPLTVCHAWRWPYPITYIDHEGAAIVKRMGRNLLDHGVALARGMAPGVTVRGKLMDGPAYAALTHQAESAEMIVVGSHEPGDLPVGSTAWRLPAHARRPVVVVRSAGTRHGEVVVGVDGSAGADAALSFAFEEAALRGWRVRAVYGCWEPAAAAENDLALFGDEDKLRQVCGSRLERAVAPWRVKYPAVEARTSLVLEAPREALFAAAERADLVVAGNRGAGGLDRIRLGATSGALLQHAPCTVAIVQATQE
ncbi:universal stress protein [Actinomadura sp. SCN-SB]|uniref:universal stress protein n=1 Tax=Actinomadura sp. SCN-SB TaxID=3373092 RepID=UPI003750A354